MVAKASITDKWLTCICVILALCANTSATVCNVSSRYWCESAELAKECGVYEQCQNSTWDDRRDAPPVDFAVYYESMSLDSRYFIFSMLYSAYLHLADITNLTLIPYGNAKEKQVGNNSWEFDCEHGPEECVGNMITTCAIDIVNNMTVSLSFINCLAISNLPPRESAAQCADEFHVPFEDVLNCTTSEYGNKLQHQMAVKTAALRPQHTYVPWVTLNGVHTAEIQNTAELGLKRLLCDAYKGKTPSECL